MQFFHSQSCQWLFNVPYRALDKAYQASKRVRNLQKDYLSYKNSVGISSRRSWYNVAIYIDSVLNQSASEIYWGLLEFKISMYVCIFLEKLFYKKFQIFNRLKKKKHKVVIHNLSSSKNKISLEGQDYIEKKFDLSTQLDPKIYCDNENWYIPNILENKDSSKNRLWYSKKYTKEDIQLDNLHRKIAWIEAVLADLDLLKNECWAFYTLMSQYNTKGNTQSLYLTPLGLKAKDIPYESLGLVPRSITRTLSRFQTELEGRSASLVLPEFRLAKYQAVASFQYMFFLILFPWFISTICKIFFLESWIENWWNTTQSQVFLSFAQEEKALRRLQEVEELLWLDIIMADSSTRQPQDLSAQIHQKTIDLVETYNQESINTVLNLFTNFISLVVIIFLLIWGKKRLAILNSWVQEVFYSLSDTMKAFFILLLTDLCIGFHSPHGWEIFIGFVLEYLGFSHNKHVISCFVSTFPVILDTVFKYWIFRHLNRISPSIVVSYHTMNE